MSILNHYHWNDDEQDNIVDTFARSPEALAREDTILTKPGGVMPDNRTDKQKKEALGDPKFRYEKTVDGNTGLIHETNERTLEVSKKVTSWEPIINDVSKNFQGLIDRQQRLDSDILGLKNLIPDGYVSGYCSQEISAGGDFIDLFRNLFNIHHTSNKRLVPLDTKFGESKGAHIDPSTRQVIFDKIGTWLVSTRVTAGEVHPNGNFGDRMAESYMVVYRDDGTPRETRKTRMLAARETTLELNEVIVIPKPGYGIRLWVNSSNWRSWKAGIEWNSVTAVRLNPGIDNDDPNNQKKEDLENNVRYQKELEEKGLDEPK